MAIEVPHITAQSSLASEGGEVRASHITVMVGLSPSTPEDEFIFNPHITAQSSLASTGAEIRNSHITVMVGLAPFAAKNMFGTLRHLLPRARAWFLTPAKALRNFIKGLSFQPYDVKLFLDQIWLDIFPYTTRDIYRWAQQFGVQIGGLTESQVRQRVDGAWKARGGQSPRYLQDTLQAAGFDVYIHEWWVPGTNPPEARNPNSYLTGATGAEAVAMGETFAVMGESVALMGDSLIVGGYPLGSAEQSTLPIVTARAGSTTMHAGGAKALAGYFEGFEFIEQPVIIPGDPAYWPYFLYIGGPNFPGTAAIEASRKDEFEALCKRICPAQQWLGMLITYD